MKKYFQLLIIIALLSMIMGCVSQEVKQTFSTYATEFGAIGGGTVGAGIGYAVGGEGGAMLGGLIGAALGATLGYQFTKQDEKNIDKVLDKRPDQKYSWCAGSNHIVTDNDIGRCSSNSQKIMMTAQKTHQGQHQCRDIQIEVIDSNGEVKHGTQKLCQGNDGKWHSA